jgi:alkylation response protein AidB-like acyl-CoA dehydrogenase
MDFDLTETEHALREKAQAFSEAEVAPRAAVADEAGALDPALIAALGSGGYLGLLVPPVYGGRGVGMLGFAVALAEIARGCASAGALVALQNAVVARALLLGGTEEQKRAHLPRLARGEILGAYAFTEPDVGSAVDAVHLQAEREGDGYVLHGTKVFVAFGAEAELLIVLGRIAGSDDSTREQGGAVTAFLVDAAGASLARERTPTMGMRATGLSTVTFDRVRVPATNRLGAEGAGLDMLHAAIDDGRIAVAALAVGIAEACRDRAIERARTRTQFGQVIGRFQAVQWLIADMATETEAARLLTWHAASLRDAGANAGDDLAEMAAIAKLAASETAVRAASRTMEIFGTWGYLAGTPVERHYRDAKATELLQGTTEIQKLAVARRLLETHA